MSIYKACDIRGRFGDELQVRHAHSLGQALILAHQPRQVLVAGDGRLSTPALKTALIESLSDGGVMVLDAGQIPTPVFYFARRHWQVPVGVMVTASHNPAPDNGFKIAVGELPITEAELERLKELMEAGASAPPRSGGRAQVIDAFEPYRQALEAVAPRGTLRGGTLRVVVDSGSGMWGPLAPGLLRRRGYEVAELFSAVDGNFPHRSPNPAIAAHLQALSTAVREQQAAVGIAFDGDGDRVAFVDEMGQPVTNDAVIVLLARQSLRLHPGAAVVYDQKCSMAVRESIQQAGGMPLREKSGHTFIKRTFLEARAAYAGELSGHHFFREIEGDDGLFGALRLATLLEASDQPLSELVASLPSYHITPDLRLKVAPGEGIQVLHQLEAGLRGQGDLIMEDGIRLERPDGWGMARISVTEPVITVRFEGKTRADQEHIRGLFRAASPLLAQHLEPSSRGAE